MKKLLYLICVSSMFGTNLFGQDLQMENVWLPNTNIAQGATIYPSAFVSNVGTILSNPSNVGFYLSKNTKLKVSDTFLGSSSLNSIYPNNSDSSVTGITIPSDLKVGTYYLFAFADYQGVVFETNEKNNSNYIKITVSSPSIDLSISSINPNSLNYSAGDIFSGSVIESNTGNTLAGGHYIGYYFSNDATLDSSDIALSNNYNNGVNAGSYSFDYPYFNLPSNISSGDYYIIALADNGNYLSESDETNNTNSVKITIVEPVSDLSVPFLYAYESTVSAGTNLSVNSTVSNNGNTFLSNVSIGYYLSADSVFSIGDTYLTSNYLGYLYAGNSVSDYPNILIPSNVPAGNYFILAIADYNNLIEEADEENNVTALPIAITAPAIDLSLYSFSIVPTDVASGSYLYAYAYEFNNGNSPAPAHSIHYFLSTDSTYDSSDVYLNNDSVYGTYPGSYNYLNPTLYIPSGTASGNYFLLAITDFNSEVAELDENNNTLFTPIRISAPYVDLAISSLEYNPLKVTPGSLVIPQMVEYNYGNDLATTHYAGYYLSTDSTYDIGDTYLGSDYVDGIYGNNSIGLSPYLYIPTDVPLGSYYILAVADYLNFISESNENNNVVVFKTEVLSPEVDFSTSFPYSDSLVATSGSYVYPTVAEFNNGTTNSRDNEVGYYLSKDMTLDGGDELLYADYVAGISAGSYAYLNPSIYIPSSLSPGIYYLLSVADYPSYVAETDESNNVSAIQLIIKAPNVDLSISGLTIDNSVITAGSSAYTSLIEYNNGSEYASYHNIGYYLSTDSIFDGFDTNVGNTNVFSQYPGGSYYSSYIYIPYYITKGNYYLIAVADNGNGIVEFDETNNSQAIPIKIGVNGIDLKISAISATNTNPSAGSFIYVTNTETNEGNMEAGAHHIGYFLSTDSTYNSGDKYLAANYFSNLAGESSADFNPALFIPTTTPDGVYYIVAVADYGNVIGEIDEYNNTRALRIVIGNIFTGDVDLSVSSLSLYPADTMTIQSNSYVYANFVELNNGSSDATGHNVGFYLSTDTTISAEDTYLNTSYVSWVSAYSATSQMVELFIPYYTPTGSYFIIAKADDGNYITESNEYNNERATLINIEQTTITGNEQVAGINKSTIQLFPNPSNGVVNFSSLDNVEEVEVMDINNHIVASQTVTSISGNSLDLSSVSAGVYFVKTKKQGVTTSTNKLIINK